MQIFQFKYPSNVVHQSKGVTKKLQSYKVCSGDFQFDTNNVKILHSVHRFQFLPSFSNYFSFTEKSVHTILIAKQTKRLILVAMCQCLRPEI